VFLAREYGVDVIAADLWVSPDEAAAIFGQAGVGDRVQAVRGEAHTLPFAADQFDAIVSVDAYEYFGTADSYLADGLRWLASNRVAHRRVVAVPVGDYRIGHRDVGPPAGG
jgi:cyclopropane fatty-acyl-phospholipid synthase-like methyltransferase